MEVKIQIGGPIKRVLARDGQVWLVSKVLMVPSRTPVPIEDCVKLAESFRATTGHLAEHYQEVAAAILACRDHLLGR